MVARAGRHPRSRWSSACPATARSTSSGWPPSWSRPRPSRSPRRTSPRTRSWSRATSVRRCWAPTAGRASATWSTRGWSSGTRWVTGANEPRPARLRPGLRSRLHPRRGARRGRDPGGRPGAGRLRSAAAGPGHRDGSHLPARPQVRRGARAARCWTSNGKLVTVTMGSYGVGVSRAVAAVAEGTCDEKGLCWPRELAPFDVQIAGHRQGRGGAQRGRRPGRASWTRPASACCWTTARPARG